MMFIFSSKITFFGLIIAQLALVFVLSGLVQKLSAGMATTLFMLYSALTGLTLSSIFIVYTYSSIASNLDPLSLSLNLEANLIIHERQFNQTLRDTLQALIVNDCVRVDESMFPQRTWWNLGISVVVFHFLRHFPALVGWLPEHTPKLAQVDPPVQPEMETQDRIEAEDGGKT